MQQCMLWRHEVTRHGVGHLPSTHCSYANDIHSRHTRVRCAYPCLQIRGLCNWCHLVSRRVSSFSARASACLYATSQCYPHTTVMGLKSRQTSCQLTSRWPPAASQNVTWPCVLVCLSLKTYACMHICHASLHAQKHQMQGRSACTSCALVLE